MLQPNEPGAGIAAPNENAGINAPAVGLSPPRGTHSQLSEGGPIRLRAFAGPTLSESV
jgi:hypothetical protein